MNELALFTGAGGGLLASKLLGWTTVGAVEIEPARRRMLLQRQRDGMLDEFPIWDDIRTFNGRPWRGLVDVVSGGFPCQDISAAGPGKGLAGDRSGLWFEFERIIGEIRPPLVFAENSPNLRTRGLGTIINGLARMGYDTRWGVLGAGHFGAVHRRSRMWLVAYANKERDENEVPKHTHSSPGAMQGKAQEREWFRAHSRELPHNARLRWGDEPDVDRTVDGVADRVDRIRAAGDGQVPIVAAIAFRILSEGVV